MKPIQLFNPHFLYTRRHRIPARCRDFVHQTSEKLRDVPRRMNAYWSPMARNNRRLAAFKDKHKGRRCFIIGNGPSLLIRDLHPLKSEITFASNKIYLAFDQTDWRPTYYTVMDPFVADNCHQTINALPLVKLFPQNLASVLLPNDQTVYYEDTGGNLRGFSPSPLIQPLYGGHTVVFSQLQLAYFMGCKEVYLMGMDHSWNLPKGKWEERLGELAISSQGEINHFHPQYRLPGEKWTLPKPELQEIAFGMARKYFEEHDRHVFNATRGGKLEVFERADFDAVIARKISRWRALSSSEC